LRVYAHLVSSFNVIPCYVNQYRFSQLTTCFSLHFFLPYGKQSLSKHSVLSLMYCIVLSMMLFPYGKWMWCFSFRNLQACEYHFPPSVDKEGFPCLSNRRNRKRSESNVFLSGCEYRKDFPVGRPNCHPSKPCHLGMNFG